MIVTPRTPFLDLAPVRAARGELRLPGSKSVSIRALLLAALSEGETVLTGLLDSDDTRVMREALKACGVPLLEEGAGLRVRGAARLPLREADIFVGNSGLSVRTLVAVLAFMDGRYRLAGVPRMHERPIGDLVKALRPLGARISYLQQQGFPPLLIEPAQSRGAQPVRVRGDASSQFLTGILQSAPLLARTQELTIEVEGELISKPYIELSIALMQRFGVEVERAVTASGLPRFTVAAGAHYRAPGTFAVEGDASSASYFLALGALAGGPVRVLGMGRSSLQGDVRFVEVLAAMGAEVTQGDDRCRAGAVRRWPLRAAQHRQLARQGNRPHCGDGDRTRQARCRGRGRPGLPAHRTARCIEASRHRYLRRSPHRDVFLARGLRWRAGADQRPRLRLQDLPGLFRPVRCADLDLSH